MLDIRTSTVIPHLEERHEFLWEISIGYGWSTSEATFDWDKLKDGRRHEVTRLNTIYDGLLKSGGVSIIRAWAALVDADVVEAAGKRWKAKDILIATGGRPTPLRIQGADHAISSDEIFELDRFPHRLAIVGGGYIACEFASIFTGLGTRVRQLVRGDRILPGFDAQTAEFLGSQMKRTAPAAAQSRCSPAAPSR